MEAVGFLRSHRPPLEAHHRLKKTAWASAMASALAWAAVRQDLRLARH